jgi:hypothetical protein
MSLFAPAFFSLLFMSFHPWLYYMHLQITCSPLPAVAVAAAVEAADSPPLRLLRPPSGYRHSHCCC